MVNITTLLLASAVAIASVEAASAGQGKCMIQGGKLKRFYPRDGELVPASGKYTVCKKKNFVASKPVTSESKAVEQITTEGMYPNRGWEGIISFERRVGIFANSAVEWRMSTPECLQCRGVGKLSLLASLLTLLSIR